MLQEFDKCLKIVHKLLRLLGLSINEEDTNRTVLQRLKYHRISSIHIISSNLSNLGQITWLLWGIATGQNLLKITFLLPCVTVCLLGELKFINFIQKAHYINEVIAILRQLLSTKRSHEQVMENTMKIWVKFLMNIIKMLVFLLSLGVLTFALGPIFLMASHYYTTGKIELFLPFIVWYPFDAFQLRAYPFVYCHQLWSAWVAVCSMLGPDSMFFTYCTFIHTQFLLLHDDIVQIINSSSLSNKNDNRSATFKTDFVQFVNRHRDLIRCVELIEEVYSICTLCNVVSSCLIICVTGFNLLALQNYALITPFLFVLGSGLLQIFLYCYYGDYVMRSSTELGDAIYNSHWNEAGVDERKYLLTVLIRSQKPCKFTAYLFTDINMEAFARVRQPESGNYKKYLYVRYERWFSGGENYERLMSSSGRLSADMMMILSTSWSYFALLNQIYRK